MKKVAFKKKDNWEGIKYENTRYLDALASIFHIATPCSAVVLYNGSYKISYNNDILSQSDQYQVIFNTKIDTAKSFINDSDAKSLLSFYLVENPDFLQFIKDELRSIKNNFKNIENIENNINLINAFKCKISEFNTSLEREVLNEAKLYAKTINNKKNPDLEKATQSKNKILQQNKEFFNDVNIIDDYYEVIKIMQSLHYLTDQEKKLDIFSKLLRPLQDVYKIVSSQIVIPVVEILENKYELHAECNIAKKLDSLLDEEIYIGISKLCCANCFQYLNTLKNIIFRGTHGVITEEWPFNSIDNKKFVDKLFNNLDISEIEAKDSPFESRRLSMDRIYEKNIIISSSIDSILKAGLSELQVLKEPFLFKRSNDGFISTLFEPECMNLHDYKIEVLGEE